MPSIPLKRSLSDSQRSTSSLSSLVKDEPLKRMPSSLLSLLCHICEVELLRASAQATHESTGDHLYYPNDLVRYSDLGTHST